MSVDGVNPKFEQQYQARRRALEEQKQRELSDIEQNYREQVDSMAANREDAIKELAQKQFEAIEDKRRETDFRIDRAKAETQERVKAYEQESRQMTDEAKRQYQTKAGLLAKNKQELEQQREYMIKQHSESMKRAQEESGEKLRSQQQKNSEVAQEIQDRQRRSTEELKEKGNIEITRLREDLADRKSQEMAQAEAKLAGLNREKDATFESVQKQIDFFKETGNEQLMDERHQQALRRIAQEAEHDDQMANLSRHGRAAINREMIRGKKEVEETRDHYSGEAEVIRKTNETRFKTARNEAEMRMQTLESDSKMQEHLAKQTAFYKKQKFEEANQQVLQKYAEESPKLRDKLTKDYLDQARQMRKEHTEQLTAQGEQFQDAIKRQLERGRAQLNEAADKSAERVSNHDSKSKDSFYRVQDLAANVQDGLEEVVIEVDVPEHEKDKVKVAQTHNAVAISGNRRFENKVKREDGTSVTTNSFQSYSQTVPVRGKLDVNKMTRTYDGGKLTFRIPKL